MSKSTVIFDICGTLANTTHREHHLLPRPKRWDLFNAAMHLDTLYPNIALLARTLHEAGHRIVLSTGRDEEFCMVTANWLASNGIAYDALYMRPHNDRREDTEIKREHLAQIREDGFAPWLVVENRTRLVRMYRDQGLTCLQCADGDF